MTSQIEFWLFLVYVLYYNIYVYSTGNVRLAIVHGYMEFVWRLFYTQKTQALPRSKTAAYYISLMPQIYSMQL